MKYLSPFDSQLKANLMFNDTAWKVDKLSGSTNGVGITFHPNHCQQTVCFEDKVERFVDASAHTTETFTVAAIPSVE